MSEIISDPNFEQVKKYARDIAEIYSSEKTKREEVQSAHRQLINYAEALNKTVLGVKEKNKEIKEAYLDTIHRLVLAAELKDEDTGDHMKE